MRRNFSVHGVCTGVGHRTVDKLKEIGIETIEQLRSRTKTALQQHLGDKTGQLVFNYSRGIDTREWQPRPDRKSVGAQATWAVRMETNAEVCACSSGRGRFQLTSRAILGQKAIDLKFTITGWCVLEDVQTERNIKSSKDVHIWAKARERESE